MPAHQVSRIFQLQLPLVRPGQLVIQFMLHQQQKIGGLVAKDIILHSNQR